MIHRIAAALVIAASLHAQESIASEIPGNTVVATLNGRKFTADDVRGLVAGLPQQFKMIFQRDPKQFLREHAYLLALIDYATSNGLDKKTPYREAVEFYRATVLANAAVTHKLANIDVTAEEQKKYYETHPTEFREVRVRMIYIPFSDPLSEEQAKTKAADVATQARSGKDFTALAAAVSGDETNAAAPFEVRASSSQPPEHMRKVLLNLKDGDVTDPLRHDNGYYVFRVESASVLPFDKVRDEVYRTIQNIRFNEWQQKSREAVTVQFENEGFFKSVGKE